MSVRRLWRESMRVEMDLRVGVGVVEKPMTKIVMKTMA